MMVVMTELVQMAHRLVAGRGRRVVPLVAVRMLRMIQEMMVVMTDQHRRGGSLRRWGVGVEGRRGCRR